jgi:hypothetical protein
MKTFYGVTMETPINKKLKNGHTMFDWIVRKRCYPSFCMRTLCGKEKITKEEIKFLKSKGCKIAFVIRDLTEIEVSGSDASACAARAIKSAFELGLPANKNIALFAQINPDWSINHNWMISFARNLKDKGFVAGFIGNTDSSKNFNFDRQSSHYIQATKSFNYYDAVFMATEPKLKSAPDKWEPYCPSAMKQTDISFWIGADIYFDDIKATDVYARDEKVLENLF